eukprot:CAMPEP_0174369442 /NCGR_PEP_ID=MMETSP0811_2-20130205/92490_1 /TAXON_ID=73025 ORGANISM="Eutreptiella gymnastica-like, Strain CCMP1594" /NCGR_SAMPLE_ID=MMETSP0811_2 /ASSEMBLY_ACC=CAM_ASM_000667 /LENGTH=82 /DNA_ID=CAMNT_0015513891 /DNA_START=29 /DNA_END=277 /DNA_ORIENTATION=-
MGHEPKKKKHDCRAAGLPVHTPDKCQHVAKKSFGTCRWAALSLWESGGNAAKQALFGRGCSMCSGGPWADVSRVGREAPTCG